VGNVRILTMWNNSITSVMYHAKLGKIWAMLI